MYSAEVRITCRATNAVIEEARGCLKNKLSEMGINIEVLSENDAQNEMVDMQLAFSFPFDDAMILTEDVNDQDLFLDFVTIIRDYSCLIKMEWEGPGDSHSISWILEANELVIKYYDWDADWEESDWEDDYEEDGMNDNLEKWTETVAFTFDGVKWKKRRKKRL